MHHSKARRSTGTAPRTPHPALSPYLLDDVGLTPSDIRAARGDDAVTAPR